jgi:hypothetical protein
MIVALPHELSYAQRLAAVREFAGARRALCVAVDFAIHAPDQHSDERNYHAHVLMTIRLIGANRFGAKTASLTVSGRDRARSKRSGWSGSESRSGARRGWNRGAHRQP